MVNVTIMMTVMAMLTAIGRSFLFLAMVLVLAATGQAFAENTVTGMRVGAVKIDDRTGLRLVIETKAPLKASLLLLQSPYRLVIDMPNTSWNVDKLARRGKLQVAPGSAYRFGNPKLEIGRLVIELEKPAAPVRVFALPPAGAGNRFVIDLLDRGKTAFLVASSALEKTPNIDLNDAVTDPAMVKVADRVKTVKPINMPLPKSKPARHANKLATAAINAPKPRPRKWIVFIDAGHGGKDPGALGKAGTAEKDITLAAARELASQLRATRKITPILARDDDRFLRLRQRIRLARQNQADLFISLHADSAPRSSARGISVFSLSDKASDKEAAALARQENSADLIGGPDLSAEDPEAAGALVRMFQRESMNQSARFAAAILQQIRDLPGGDKRGHRFAGFAVLKAPDMPSVLIEMGFLSNRQDEANLIKKSYRQNLSKRLTKAILVYLNEYGPKI
ncbi:N-acetylmuramoyl-L-alanine amidase [Alphaproteobacteria bacterium]|nr:N-acetylmuramoyl-L-alanine amidase [Alphaproteobacteria bacterium]